MFAFLGYLTADWAARLLPVGLANRLAVGLARLLFTARLPARRVLEANLARLLPEASPHERRATARRAFEHFALTLVDVLRLGRLEGDTLERAVEVRGAEHLERARSMGRGVILLSAHLGNWEWGAAWLAAHLARLGARLHVVARPHRSRWVERWYARRRGACGVWTLPGRPLWPGAAQALRRREWVALMGDRRGTRGSGNAWAAALARRTGAVVLPAIMLRVAAGRYAACFGPPLSPERCAAGGCRAAIARHLAGHAAQWCAFEPVPESLA